mgnify:FL=1
MKSLNDNFYLARRDIKSVATVWVIMAMRQHVNNIGNRERNWKINIKVFPPKSRLSYYLETEVSGGIISVNARVAFKLVCKSII